jgi:DNA-binding NtrC family response regulator
MKLRRVLLVSRDPQFQKTLSTELTHEGATVIAKHGVSGALQTICSQESEVDLAVIDFDDGCHGMTLLSAIRDCLPNLPILAVTSRDKYHGAAIAYAKGVVACLAKPVTAEELGLVVAGLGTSKSLLVAA